MTYFYSPSKGGFYDDTFHFKHEIPKDAIRLTDVEYQNFLAGVNSNKILVLNKSKKLELIDRVIPTSEILQSFTANLQKHLDDTANLYGYDNINTAVSYAEESAVLKFQIEGRAFRSWRSLFWLEVNKIKDLVLAGDREIPSLEQLIEELPKLNLPPSDLQ